MCDRHHGAIRLERQTLHHGWGQSKSKALVPCLLQADGSDADYRSQPRLRQAADIRLQGMRRVGH